MKEISRNDPCPCGSGKKYKKCCALKTPMQRRTYTQLETSSVKSSMERITGMVSKTIRNTHPETAEKFDKDVKKKFDKLDENLPPKEDVDPKS